MTNFHIYFYDIKRRFPNCAPQRPGASRDFAKYCFLFELCVLFFQTAAKLSGRIVIKLFDLNYLMNGSVRYLFWSTGAVKNC